MAGGDKAKMQTAWAWEMFPQHPETLPTVMSMFATRGVGEGRGKLLVVCLGLWFIANIGHLHLGSAYLT